MFSLCVGQRVWPHCGCTQDLHVCASALSCCLALSTTCNTQVATAAKPHMLNNVLDEFKVKQGFLFFYMLICCPATCTE